MKIVYDTGADELARVYVAELEDGSNIEFVESIQPPYSWREKWVLIVSTLKGCPVGCPICDAGGTYRGKLTRDEILAQMCELADLAAAHRTLVSRGSLVDAGQPCQLRQP